MRKFLSILAMTTMLASCAQKDLTKQVGYTPTSPIAEWADKCKSPCVLPKEYQNGGRVDWFQQAALILKQQDKGLIINTPICVSACTILVDELQYYGGKVCVNENVTYGFHRGEIFEENGTSRGHFTYEYRNRILGYFLEGKLGENGEILWLSAPAGSNFFPVCHYDNHVISPGLIVR